MSRSWKRNSNKWDPFVRYDQRRESKSQRIKEKRMIRVGEWDKEKVEEK